MLERVFCGGSRSRVTWFDRIGVNLAEAWRKRRYQGAFVSKLNDAEAEAAETQVWLQFSVECGYLDAAVGPELHTAYDHLLGKLVK